VTTELLSIEAGGDGRPAATQASRSTLACTTLIARMAVGDKLALQVLFARHHVRVYRFIMRFVRDRAAAEDVLNEVFLDVWRCAATFRARSSVATWLLAVARFKALSSGRRRCDAELDDDTAASLVDPSDDPETAVRKKDQCLILRRCLTRLSPEHREVVDLVYYQGAKIEEVAEILRIPPATVKTRMFRARRRLSELLAAAGIDRSAP
jgi:RNA polymerase sigma-70 factor (ECF subfamily)